MCLYLQAISARAGDEGASLPRNNQRDPDVGPGPGACPPPPYQNDHLPDEATPGLLRSICRTSCPDRRASLGFPDSIPDRIAMNLESRSFRLAKNSGPIPFADPVGATPRRLEW